MNLLVDFGPREADLRDADVRVERLLFLVGRFIIELVQFPFQRVEPAGQFVAGARGLGGETVDLFLEAPQRRAGGSS